jgi:hypothetical protein
VGELQLVLGMNGRGVLYPLGPYPEIQEFAAMLQQVKSGRAWSGMHFHASADPPTPERTARFHFRRRTDRVMFTFAEEEWESLKDLFSTALEDPRLQLVLAELSLDYGEL